jgi:hypothetical protein
MMEVVRYSAKYKPVWDAFVVSSKNGTFLLHRDYMEYHADRFTDHSLLFYKKGKLLALLPANEVNTEIHSHGGLTYGGIISDKRMKATTMLAIFEAMIRYYHGAGFTKLFYKTIPHIYHQAPAEEDLYALYRHSAILSKREVLSVVDLNSAISYSYLRKRKLQRVKTHPLRLQQSFAFADFMRVAQVLLQEKHHVKPAHSADEITRLTALFPDNIKLFTATESEAIVAGIIVYETPVAVHCQYISTTERGRAIAALDALTNYLLTEVYPHKKYLNFGSSVKRQLNTLNEGLIRNKESYGARTIVQDFYELAL